MTAATRSAPADSVKRAIRPIWSRLVNARLERGLVGPVFRDRAELNAYCRELSESGLPEVLNAAQERFAATVLGTIPPGKAAWGFGAITRGSRGRLFAVIRALRPEILVETGVCNGVSSAVILQALEANGFGRLHSIDLPEFASTEGMPADHRVEDCVAVISPGKEPGWLVPAELRQRWELTLGPSQDELPELLEKLGAIDLFFHDSDHSYENMMFEFELAFDRLRTGGALLSDDIAMNESFFEVASRYGRTPHLLGEGVGLIFK